MFKIKKNLNFNKRQGGVTLIELLIAISLASIIGLTILSSFSAGLKTFNKAQVLNGPQTDVLIAFEKIERDLGNAFKWSGIGFNTGAGRISFPGLINHQEKDAAEGLVLGNISYYFDRGSRALFREEMTYPQFLAGTRVTAEKLAAVEEVSFDYFYKDPVTDRYGWKSMLDADQVPLGVKVKIKFKGIDENIELARTVFLVS